jgi:ActR/RegA family two-component response regulator
MLVVHHDPLAAERLKDLLQGRFGAAYDVETALTADSAMMALTTLRDAGSDVALVLSEQWLPGATGAELLAQVQSVFRDVRRALLTTWADRTTADWIVKAAAVGQFDALVVEPWRDVDEAFYFAMSELLVEWEQLHRPPFAAVCIVGEPSSLRAWMWTTAAPASYARRASSAISTGVYGIAGQCFLVVTAPVRAQDTMTLSASVTPRQLREPRRRSSTSRGHSWAECDAAPGLDPAQACAGSSAS